VQAALARAKARTAAIKTDSARNSGAAPVFWYLGATFPNGGATGAFWKWRHKWGLRVRERRFLRPWRLA